MSLQKENFNVRRISKRLPKERTTITVAYTCSHIIMNEQSLGAGERICCIHASTFFVFLRKLIFLVRAQLESVASSLLAQNRHTQ